MSKHPQLSADLAQAEAIKADMTKLLRELETLSTGESIAKPGAWRHHPLDWAEQHLPPSPSQHPSEK